MEERKGIYRVLVGKPERKRPLARPKHRWKDNIKRIFTKWDVGAWTELTSHKIGTDSGHL